VVAINISSKKGTFKHPLDVAHLKADFGIEGDAHAGNWHRQISLLAQESVDKMTAMGVKDLTPGKFAEIHHHRGNRTSSRSRSVHGSWWARFF